MKTRSRRAGDLAWRSIGCAVAMWGGAQWQSTLAAQPEASSGTPRFVDNSLLIASEFPGTWPSAPFPRFQLTRERTIGPDSPYNVAKVQAGGYFLFAPLKIRDCHGGPGRAIVLQ